MVELQAICKCLQDKSTEWLDVYGIDHTYFDAFHNEFTFIADHAKQYGNVPDVETFLAKFTDFNYVAVSESTKYLVDSLKEEYFYRIEVEAVEKAATLLKDNSFDAFNYLQTFVSKTRPPESIKGVDIIHDADVRLEAYKEKLENPDAVFIPTGLPELDKVIGGWAKGNELILLYARTGVGKTQLAIKNINAAWKAGYRVGLMSPEMRPDEIGYRFDTVEGHFSNTSLRRGKQLTGYDEYIEALKDEKIPLFVTTPSDFQGKVTPAKLRAWIIANNLDVLVVDGLTYVKPEYGNFENMTTKLTAVSEELMTISQELGVPIIVVHQANRDGAGEDGLKLTHVRGSDGIAHNCTLVIGLESEDDFIKLSLQKTRNGGVGNTLHYIWDMDLGVMSYISNKNSYGSVDYSSDTVYNDTGDVF